MNPNEFAYIKNRKHEKASVMRQEKVRTGEGNLEVCIFINFRNFIKQRLTDNDNASLN